MSDTGGTSDPLDGQAVSDTGESSVYSDWSVVDEHGDLADDDTTSTSSSVEIVEEDSLNDTQLTPIAGSPSGGFAPRFILRLPSHQQVSDTDEDQVEDSSSGSSSVRCDSADLVSKSTSCDSTGKGFSVARVSQGELDELRQTLDTLKKNLQQSHAEDSSVSSIEMFGDGKPDKQETKSGTDKLPQSSESVENLGLHGNILNDDLSPDSSISSSYSFLSRDAGTECTLLRDRSFSCERGEHIEGKSNKLEDNSGKPGINNLDLGTSKSDSQNVEDTDQPETINEEPSTGAGRETSWSSFGSVFGYPVEYVILVGLAVYTGIFILTLLYIQHQDTASVFKVEDVQLNQCLQNRQDLQRRLAAFENGFHGNDNKKMKLRAKLRAVQLEKEELAAELEDKERDILELQKQFGAILNEKKVAQSEFKEAVRKHEELQNENEKLQTALDEASHLHEQNMKECTADVRRVLQQCENGKGDEKSQMAKELDAYQRQCQNDIGKVKTQCQVDTDKIKSQCQVDTDEIKSQCQVDTDKIKNQCCSDIDEVKTKCQMDTNLIKSQCQIDKESIRSQFQSDLDSLRAQNKAFSDNAKGQCGKNMGSASSEGDDVQSAKVSQFGDNVDGKNTEVPESSSTTGQQNFHGGSRFKSKKRATDAQSESCKNSEKDKDQSQSRTDKSTGKRNERETCKDHSKEGKSGEYSEKGGHSAFSWADTVFELMNKTKEQIQDTWVKVKNMSETLWQEHQPSLLRLQKSFSHKLQNLSKKFQDKVANKMNKWYRRFKKHAWKKDSGRTANTKRREHSGNAGTCSNHTVGERLVKLSHQVEALNAKKFQKWRDSPKVLDIQREFEKVNKLVKTGQSDRTEKSEKKLSDEFLGWFNCQFSWWNNLDVVRVTDDCYLSLCCWQVKVTGGDVKQCRKMKRKQGIVEDTCSLGLTSKALNPGRVKSDDSRTDSEKVLKENSNYKAPGHKDGMSDQEPGGSDEENWFLVMGEERAYLREEPDDWFFRRKNKKVTDGEPASKEDDNWFLKIGEDREYHRQEPDDWFFRRKNERMKQQRKSRYSDQDDNFDDDDDYYDDDGDTEVDECQYDVNTGHCNFH